MSTIGIITEYNPFHYGHLYHLNKSKELCKSNTIICIMNGNFVQRGEPALLDKWTRAKIALANGVDMVIELPLIYGIRSAEYFAKGAISLMTKSKIIDKFVFGSEIGDIKPLKNIAYLLSDEDKYFKKILQKKIAKGYPFPKARDLAIQNYIKLYPDIIDCNIDELIKIIAEPNNILGIEYLKSLISEDSPIIPYTIKRIGSNYHEQELKQKITSATAIREKVYKKEIEMVKNYLPEYSYDLLLENIEKGKAPIILDYLGVMVSSAIRKLNSRKLSEFAEVNNGLENRIHNEAHNTADFKELTSNVKTKAFTWTRIQRNLLHILFNIKEYDFNLIDQYGPQYIRVLGIKKERLDLLSKLNKNTSLKVIINPSDYLKEINTDSHDPLIKSLSYDIVASDIYSLLYKNPAYRQGHQDFTTPLIKY